MLPVKAPFPNITPDVVLVPAEVPEIRDLAESVPVTVDVPAVFPDADILPLIEPDTVLEAASEAIKAPFAIKLPNAVEVPAIVPTMAPEGAEERTRPLMPSPSETSLMLEVSTSNINPFSSLYVSILFANFYQQVIITIPVPPFPPRPPVVPAPPPPPPEP